MRIYPLALAAVLAAVWTGFPLVARAYDKDDDDEERVEIRKRVRHHGDQDGDREDGPPMRGREGGRDGGEGPRGGRDRDPEMREKMEKTRELERKLREVSKTLRQGSDAEKAAAKTEARKLLGELFDAKLAMDSAMLEKMEKHAVELKAKIAKKKAGREKAIENRLTRMSGDDDDWN